MRRSLRFARNDVILAVLAAVLGACGIRPTEQPRPTPAPPTPTLPPVTGQAENLIIQLADLPGGFKLAGEERPGGNAYSAIYLRPELLAQENPPAEMLGVIANLSIFADPAAGRAQFAAQGMDPASIAKDLREASGATGEVDVQPHAASVAGADEVVAFRARYAIGPTRLLEYRYRILVSNAVVNLIVTAPASATEAEPAAFREQAQAVAERQVKRINDTRR